MRASRDRDQLILSIVDEGPGFVPAMLAQLGKHKLEKSCLYINRLDQVDMGVLEQVIANNVAEMNRLYPPA